MTKEEWITKITTMYCDETTMTIWSLNCFKILEIEDVYINLLLKNISIYAFAIALSNEIKYD